MGWEMSYFGAIEKFLSSFSLQAIYVIPEFLALSVDKVQFELTIVRYFNTL